VKVHAGVLLSPATCAAIGPALQDFLASWRVNGLQAPSDVRIEIREVAELGRRFQAAQMAKRAAERTSDERPLANECSPSATSVAVTYSSAQAAKRLGVGQRAVQRRAERGSLRALRTPGGELRFERAEIDRIARKEPQ